jgi:hypothetical protein
VQYLTNITAIPPKVDVILRVGHGVLHRREAAVRIHKRVEDMYPNHGKERTSGTESDLSWRNTAGVLRDVQGLDKHI